MQPDHTSRITRAFETLTKALMPYVQDAMEDVYGAEWRRQAEEGLPNTKASSPLGPAEALLLIMSNNWDKVFSNRLGTIGRSLVSELRMLPSENTFGTLSASDAYRLLDTVARLLRAIGDETGAGAVQQDAAALMQLQFHPPPSQQPDIPPPISDERPPTVTLPEEAPPALHDKPEPIGEAPPQPIEEDYAAEQANADEDVENKEAEIQEHDGRESGGVRSWFGRLFHHADEKDLEPLELRTRLLDKVEDALRRFRSDRPLRFNQIAVHILAPISGDRFAYDAALNDLEPLFEQAVLNRLSESGFHLPTILIVKPEIHARAPKNLQAEFEEAGPIVVDLRKEATRISATISVVKGTAEQDSYRIDSTSTERLNLGRLRDIEDDHYGHIIRRNHIAFLGHTDPALSEDERAINETVSRRHARIEYEAQAGAFVLLNEQGVTSISRPGLPNPVRVSHQRATLQDGDRIYLGRACLLFEWEK